MRKWKEWNVISAGSVVDVGNFHFLTLNKKIKEITNKFVKKAHKTKKKTTTTKTPHNNTNK